MNQFSTKNRLVDSVLICIFLVTLFVPFLTWVVRHDVSYSEVEKRELEKFPSLAEQHSITEFTAAFDRYFQDHFGLREWFIRRYQQEVNKRFNISGVSSVLEGEDGWLFFSGDQLLADLNGRLRFSREEEQRFWETLTEKESWLRKRGIAYIFLVAPNKQSIYPEYLPTHYQKIRNTSRFEQLLANRPEQGGQALLDVTPRLRQEKSGSRLYNKSDTHWNYLGAHLAYQGLIERVQELFPAFMPRKDFHFAPQWLEGVGGDLAVMLGRETSMLEARPMVEGDDFTTVRKNLTPELSAFLTLPQLTPFYSAKKSGQLRVLVLHDSFFQMLKPFVCESFGEVLSVTQYYDTATQEFLDRNRLALLLDIFQPDLVIEELVERNLPHLLTTEYQD